MTQANRHDIHVLNDLIQTSVDSADGYHDAAAGTDVSTHRSLFKRRAFERQKLAEELSESVRQMGGEPKTEGSFIAKTQRAFADARHAIMRDELSLVAPVENAEDAVKARFEKALADSSISATTRETIRRAYASIAGAHDELSELKHSLESQRDDQSRLFPH